MSTTVKTSDELIADIDLMTEQAEIYLLEQGEISFMEFVHNIEYGHDYTPDVSFDFIDETMKFIAKQQREIMPFLEAMQERKEESARYKILMEAGRIDIDDDDSDVIPSGIRLISANEGTDEDLSYLDDIFDYTKYFAENGDDHDVISDDKFIICEDGVMLPTAPSGFINMTDYMDDDERKDYEVCKIMAHEIILTKFL